MMLPNLSRLMNSPEAILSPVMVTQILDPRRRWMVSRTSPSAGEVVIMNTDATVQGTRSREAKSQSRAIISNN
eukprot:scaffold25938_cov212-Skeletonema_marinoi.AAC.1